MRVLLLNNIVCGCMCVGAVFAQANTGQVPDAGQTQAQMPQQEDDITIPVPPKGQPLDDAGSTILGGRTIKGQTYISQESKESVVSFYREFFKKNQFQEMFAKDLYDTGIQQIRFKRGSLTAEIMIASEGTIPSISQKGIVVATAKYIQKPGTLDFEHTPISVKDTLPPPPEQDRPGEDIYFIPRPPKSVRLMSMNQGVQQHLMYSTELTIDEATQYYRGIMEQLGWQVTNDVDMGTVIDAMDANSYKNSTFNAPNVFSDGTPMNALMKGARVLHFTSQARGRVDITICASIYGKDKGSHVTILYYKQELPFGM